MLRTQVVKLTRAPFRSFSVAAIRSAEGDLGGVRSGGQTYVPQNRVSGADI